MSSSTLSLIGPKGSKILSRVELSQIHVPPSAKITAFRHVLIAETIEEFLFSSGYGNHLQFHLLSEDSHYQGFFMAGEAGELKWVVGGSNGYDARPPFELHSGFCVPDCNHFLAFHATETLAKRQVILNKETLATLVNEKLSIFRMKFQAEFDRMECYKSKKLDRKEAHHIICCLLYTEIVAGRCAHELITSWHNRVTPYLKPDTLWSLYLLCTMFLNRLQAPQLIERTISLQGFFDEAAGFKPKQVHAVQNILL